MPYLLKDFELAVTAVKEKRLTPTQASRKYGVPRKTVDNHARGVYTRHKYGPARMLEEEEEQTLVGLLEYIAGQGFPVTRAMLRTYIVELVRDRETLFNIDSGPSDKWFRSFFARHDSLTERVAEKYDRSRAGIPNPTVVDQYFDLLENTVDRLGIKDKPEQVFSAGGTGWSGEEEVPTQVVVIEGQHMYMQQQSFAPTGQITAHICMSGDGRVLPTFLIFEESLLHTPCKDVPGVWMVDSSESGHIDSELFQRWFENLFLKHCGNERPVLLIMDNDDSHINVEIVKLARENDVELLGLPPNTGNILQPLDASIDGLIKHNLSTIAARLGFLSSKNAVINEANFPAILSNTIDNVCSPTVVKGAFRKCGIVPLNRKKVDKTQLTKNDITPGSQEEENRPMESGTVVWVKRKHEQNCEKSTKRKKGDETLTTSKCAKGKTNNENFTRATVKKE